MNDDWKFAKGTALVDIVARLLKGWNFDIQTGLWARDKSGVEHEIDVLGKRTEDFGDFTLAVECKNLQEPTDVVQIRDFNDKLSSLGYAKGLFVSTGGFTPPALQYAKSVGIEVWDDTKLKENLDKVKSTADLIPDALPVASDFNVRVFPPLVNADRFEVLSLDTVFSPYFIVTYHCFAQQWVNHQLTNLESKGLVVVDGTSGEIVDAEVRVGAAPQLPRSGNFSGCDQLKAKDLPIAPLGPRVQKPSISESEARQKVQLEVTKNISQTYAYQSGRGSYARTEQKTVRPRISEVKITSSRMMNVPITTITLGFKNVKYERVVQAATFKVIKDDFWTCSADRKDGNPPFAICEECGAQLCEKHLFRCKVCSKRLCRADAVDKGLISKSYCKTHAQ